MPITPPPVPGASCLDLAREYFRASDNRDRLREYLAIQGKLTLHRLAWAYLKLNDGDASSLEEVIEDLLVRRDPELYRRFVRGGPRAISDRKLQEVVGLLRGETSRRFGRDPRSRGFLLEESDLKMLDLLARSEKAFGRGGQGGIMGFAAMIDASYRGRIDTPRGRALNLRIAERTVRELQRKSAAIHAELGAFLEARGCGSNPEAAIASCVSSASVPSAGLGALLEGSREVQNALWNDLNGGEAELHEAFQWGSYWLRVSRRTTAGE